MDYGRKTHAALPVPKYHTLVVVIKLSSEQHLTAVALVFRVKTCFVTNSKVKWRVTSSAKMILLLMTFCIVSPLHGAVTFKDGAYSGVQIKVDENLPLENCREILRNLEVCMLFYQNELICC